MDHRLRGGVPGVRLASRLQLATFFAPSISAGGARDPSLTADVRVVIRRHLPVAGQGGTRIVEKVAEDIGLRRRPSRKLRAAERVERALAEEVLPFVGHPFDRGAVVAAEKEICAHVAAACANRYIAHGGTHVLVLIDTFACPVVFRPPPRKPMQSVACAPRIFVVKAANPCMDSERTVPAKKPKPVGVIGDRRPKPVAEKFKGWVPW